jgi:hypothetical protein
MLFYICSFSIRVNLIFFQLWMFVRVSAKFSTLYLQWSPRYDLKRTQKMALFRCYAVALRILSLFLIQLFQSFNMFKLCICNCLKKDRGLFWSLVCWNRIQIVEVINKTVNVVVCYVNFILDFFCLLWATQFPDYFISINSIFLLCSIIVNSKTKEDSMKWFIIY